MGRPENTISASGPVADFAQQLRLLRQHAALTLRQLAARTGLSTATLSVAAAGRKLPTWEVTSAYVQACGGDIDDWRLRWEHAACSSRFAVSMRLPGSVSSMPGGQHRDHRLGFPGGSAPLPVTADSTGEFMQCLLRVKIWAGDPPVRALSRRAGLPPSTMQDFLHRERRKLPPVDTVCAFLKGCGVDDANVIAEWVFAWRRLKLAETENRRRSGRRTLISALPVRSCRTTGKQQGPQCCVFPGQPHLADGLLGNPVRNCPARCAGLPLIGETIARWVQRGLSTERRDGRRCMKRIPALRAPAGRR
jgi:lambda repressor-like predicted transcriptional regulator